jgi:hypothetical protein
MNSRRLMASPEAQDRASHQLKASTPEGRTSDLTDVRFGSKADIAP